LSNKSEVLKESSKKKLLTALKVEALLLLNFYTKKDI